MIMTTSFLIGSLVLACLLGILLGYWLSGKKNDNCKDKARITELETSLQEYKQQVQEHFSTTASLFQDLGHNYRTLYNYMAESASELCPEIPDTAVLQFDATNLLPEKAQTNVEETAPIASAAAVTDSPQSEQKSVTPTDSPTAVVEDADTTAQHTESNAATALKTASTIEVTDPTQDQTDGKNPETNQTSRTASTKPQDL